MGNQTLSQDELNLLLNDVIAAQEDVSEPDSVSVAILSASDTKILAETVDVSMQNAVESLSKPARESIGFQRSEFPGAAEKPSRESMGAQRPDERKVTVQPVQFMSLDTGDSKKEGEVNKLELIYDVGLQLTVELGRTEKTLKEILEIGPGSIVGLDKLAGEPLDILVNGKLLARGEVIVIDENYGVRIKEIISSGERIGSLKA
jgi:flagellar motor switch protein FliN/FliY